MPAKKKIPKAVVTAVRQVTNKRAKLALDHILKNGFITTEELTTLYGYQHPPRAARDIRELGFPLETFSVKAKDGRSIAAYRFGDLSNFQGIVSARRLLPKKFKEKLISEFGSQCNICSGKFESRYLQIDHRIPFGVRGEVSGDLEISDFQLLDGSCNRAKSWSCEHCDNYLRIKDAQNCLTCYWGAPEDYSHIAMEDTRRVDILWQGAEVADYERVRKKADQDGMEIPEYVKRALSARTK